MKPRAVLKLFAHLGPGVYTSTMNSPNPHVSPTPTYYQYQNCPFILDNNSSMDCADESRPAIQKCLDDRTCEVCHPGPWLLDGGHNPEHRMKVHLPDGGIAPHDPNDPFDRFLRA